MEGTRGRARAGSPGRAEISHRGKGKGVAAGRDGPARGDRAPFMYPPSGCLRSGGPRQVGSAPSDASVCHLADPGWWTAGGGGPAHAGALQFCLTAAIRAASRRSVNLETARGVTATAARLPYALSPSPEPAANGCKNAGEQKKRCGCAVCEGESCVERRRSWHRAQISAASQLARLSTSGGRLAWAEGAERVVTASRPTPWRKMRDRRWLPPPAPLLPRGSGTPPRAGEGCGCFTSRPRRGASRWPRESPT